MDTEKYNQIGKLLQERGIRVADLARKTGIPAPTLYNAIKKPQINNIAVETFIGIARGLGMTVEELYYGKPVPRRYADPRQAALNESYERLSEDGKSDVAKYVGLLATVPELLEGSKSGEAAQTLGA